MNRSIHVHAYLYKKNLIRITILKILKYLQVLGEVNAVKEELAKKIGVVPLHHH